MARKAAKPRDSSDNSTADSLDTAEFDREFVINSFAEPDPAARRRWQRARRKRGRPTVGEGAKVVSVSIERRLLARADRLAKKKRVSRAALISRGLRAVLAAEGRAAQ
ncbi:MAG: hypothetical protein CHACPFDD_00331 [Phycisphaerae bacterium]|nr:hypothetical protein [Phycisphaerae bacterium]